MLAHKTRPNRVHFPAFIQPKLNGVRALHDPRYRHFQSRYGEIWLPQVVQHLLSPLTRLTTVVTDGEMYRHGMSLQEINSRIAVTRKEPHAESHLIEYHLFDIPVNAPFAKRYALLEQLRPVFDGTPVKIVETVFVRSQAEWDHYHNLWLAQGYEGSMWRNPKMSYGFAHDCTNKENRWWHLQKRKDWQDMLATIVGVEEMTDEAGNFKDTLGAFHLIGENGSHFSAGSGLTAAQRDAYWLEGYAMNGRKVHIRYMMLSDSKVPIHPVIECVYD